MTTTTFTLYLERRNATDDELEALADALYDAGCTDGLVGARDGVVFVEFDREGDDPLRAIWSAIHEAATAGERVHRVGPADLVTITEIADRLGRTRQSVRQLVTGERGPGGFPVPTQEHGRSRQLWRWLDVARWLSHHGLADGHAIALAEAVEITNARLVLRELSTGEEQPPAP